MKSIFIKDVTSEGNRKVINVPKKININVGDSVIVKKINLDEIELKNE